jgi:hypothetical protein
MVFSSERPGGFYVQKEKIPVPKGRSVLKEYYLFFAVNQLVLIVVFDKKGVNPTTVITSYNWDETTDLSGYPYRVRSYCMLRAALKPEHFNGNLVGKIRTKKYLTVFDIKDCKPLAHIRTVSGLIYIRFVTHFLNNDSRALVIFQNYPHCYNMCTFSLQICKIHVIYNKEYTIHLTRQTEIFSLKDKYLLKNYILCEMLEWTRDILVSIQIKPGTPQTSTHL